MQKSPYLPEKIVERGHKRADFGGQHFALDRRYVIGTTQTELIRECLQRPKSPIEACPNEKPEKRNSRKHWDQTTFH